MYVKGPRSDGRGERPSGHTQGEMARDIRFLTDAHSPFEQGERPVEVTLAEEQPTEPPIAYAPG